VAHELLDGANIHPGHRKAAGKGVPQAVPRESPNLRTTDGRLKPVARPGQRLAQSVADRWPGAVSGFAELFERSQRRAI